MKILAFEMSRITALFHLTRQAGQMYLPDAIAAVVRKYSFTGVPKTFEEMDADRVDLLHGKFQGVAINALEIYSDGIVVSSRSDTKILDAFIADLRAWLQSDLGISVIENRTINRLYESNVILEADQGILGPLDAFHEIGEMVENSLMESSGIRATYLPFGITFSDDPSQNPNLKPVPFRVERRAGAEFALGQFFSSAPVKTSQHLAILKAMEATSASLSN